MVGRRKPLESTFGLHPFLFLGCSPCSKIKRIKEQEVQQMSYDVEPHKELKLEVQKHVEDFVDSQRKAKKDSMQRALNWMSLASNNYPALAELAITLETSTEQFCAVLEVLGILIDLDIIDEFCNKPS